ncbi:MAG: hypothetical protein ACM3JG_19220 [Thiohalocapsa sp.]
MNWAGTLHRASPAAAASARSRLPQAASDRLWHRLGILVLLAAAAVAALTFRDYGVTWDEDAHNWYGVLALQYYVSGFADRRALDFNDLVNYGALFDMLAAALHRVSPFGIYETRHLLNTAFGLLGLAGVWRLGSALGGRRAGFFALVFLLLTPNYYGQMFNNPKDIPFAVGGVWASYYIVRLLPSLPRPPLRLVVKLGLAVGLALGVRIGGFLFLCYLGLILALSAVWQGAISGGLGPRRLRVAVAAGVESLWRVLLPVGAIGFAVMLLFWPWGQQDPIANPLHALAFFSHQIFPYYTLFDGRFVPAFDLPWSYLPTYIVLALPELVLALLGASLVLAVALLAQSWRRGVFGERRVAVLGLFLLAFSIVFPVVYAIAIKAVLFDGMRHFIFVLPPIAAAAGLAMDRLLQALSGRRFRHAVYAALGLYATAHLTVMVLLHPDEYVYYNALVGGVAGAQRRFKLDYWANSYAEAVRGLQTYLQKQYGADYKKRQFTVAVCGPTNSAAYYFPENFHELRQRENADFFIAFTKDNCDRALPGDSVYRVERMGALLSVVLDRRRILAAKRVAKEPLAHVAPPPAGAAPNRTGGTKAHGI